MYERLVTDTDAEAPLLTYEERVVEFEIEKSLRINFLKAVDLIRVSRAPSEVDPVELRTAYNTIINSGLFQRYIPESFWSSNKTAKCPKEETSQIDPHPLGMPPECLPTGQPSSSESPSAINTLTRASVSNDSLPNAPSASGVDTPAKLSALRSAHLETQDADQSDHPTLSFEDESPHDRNMRLLAIRLYRSKLGHMLMNVVSHMNRTHRRMVILWLILRGKTEPG
ncbi:uncharacterized protein BJ171DRAFT_478359 [Polychytrium aggregatum]|uniref:uncharacterized protein n=1 Tax=Polychytrium aggregatum TaxID=110093 RepID=UPI0022FF32B6|nr:uncharacterized protein BJ171DRAFT_478359 [Polychytrium aggregatum]KAI9197123.1 hypothetical protein BJ171DRAFT_478359 [Polychytrium aggregatum]